MEVQTSSGTYVGNRRPSERKEEADQSPISSPSLRLSAPSLRGLRVSGSRKVAHPVRVPTEGRVCRHTFSRGRARCQGPSPTVMKRGNFGLINRLANVLQCIKLLRQNTNNCFSLHIMCIHQLCTYKERISAVLQSKYQHIDDFLEQFGSSIVTKLERHLSGCYLFFSFTQHSYISPI